MSAGHAVGTKVLESDSADGDLAEEAAANSRPFTIPSGVALTQPSGATGDDREEQRRLRRLLATTRSLLQLAEGGVEDEREVVMTVVQAAAIWHDVDARAYRRDLQGRFVLNGWLPGADLTAGPRDFSAFSVVSSPLTRISSTVEQEQLGWHNLPGELVLLPIAAGSEIQPRWVLAIPLEADSVVPPNLLILCDVLSLCLDRMARQRGQELTKRVTRELTERHEPMAQLATAAVAQTVGVLGAAQGRLLMDVGAATDSPEATESWTLAAAGGEWTAGPAPNLGPGQSLLTARRLTLAFSVGARAVAMLDVVAAEDAEFNIGHGVLLEWAVGAIRPWLAGVLGGTAAQALQPQPPRFEQRIEEELVRTKRFHLETGLLVVEAPAEALKDTGPETVPARVPEVVAGQLRSSDVSGRLQGGEICALLVHTHADGTASAAARLLRTLQALARLRGLPPATLGMAMFGTGDESAADVLARAREDARLRGSAQD